MSKDHLIFLSIPGLRVGDVDVSTTPTLHGWANQGMIAELTPTFPCVTSTVQATFLTGVAPERHGVIANGFFDRQRREVAFWVAHNDVIEQEQVWDALHSQAPPVSSAVWHAQNIKGAAADFIITPAPIHQPDGTTKLWCYAKPDGLYDELLEVLGHFPLQHYWGPLANIESTRWILRAAAWLIRRSAPRLHWIYIPHLDYAAQKHGPDSKQAGVALIELDRELTEFADEVGESAISECVRYLVAGEYALTDVTGVIYPNRLLRDAGLLSIRDDEGVEYVDMTHTPALAMVDHQLAHIYLHPDRQALAAKVAAMFQDQPGIVGVCTGDDRSIVGMNHQRSGDVVLVADDEHWFAYYWWNDDVCAPPFARTVDIHRKPGYDPVELFLDPATRSIPLDATLIRGSHGTPAIRPRHRTALLCSSSCDAYLSADPLRDTDIKALTLKLLGL